ncbi:MAG: hypothetical protein JW882_14585 [Deltaproteobacteria bacterium]|nr:hypothetical protein [Deltaproteobacteria bacterium]
MISRFFKENGMITLAEALDIAEDRIGNYYKFSLGQWKRHRYDIKTQEFLTEDEITKFAFALLNKCTNITDVFESKTKQKDFYFICLQDTQILNAVKRDKNLRLLPLLVYIFTHELVHIVRFSSYFQRYEAPVEDREEEEKIVHAITYEILKKISLPKLDYILESYQGHRICALGAG